MTETLLPFGGIFGAHRNHLFSNTMSLYGGFGSGMGGGSSAPSSGGPQGPQPTSPFVFARVEQQIEERRRELEKDKASLKVDLEKIGWFAQGLLNGSAHFLRQRLDDERHFIQGLLKGVAREAADFLEGLMSLTVHSGEKSEVISLVHDVAVFAVANLPKLSLQQQAAMTREEFAAFETAQTEILKSTEAYQIAKERLGQRIESLKAGVEILVSGAPEERGEIIGRVGFQILGPIVASQVVKSLIKAKVRLPKEPYSDLVVVRDFLPSLEDGNILTLTVNPERPPMESPKPGQSVLPKKVSNILGLGVSSVVAAIAFEKSSGKMKSSSEDSRAPEKTPPWVVFPNLYEHRQGGLPEYLMPPNKIQWVTPEGLRGLLAEDPPDFSLMYVVVLKDKKPELRLAKWQPSETFTRWKAGISMDFTRVFHSDLAQHLPVLAAGEVYLKVGSSGQTEVDFMTDNSGQYEIHGEHLPALVTGVAQQIYPEVTLESYRAQDPSVWKDKKDLRFERPSTALDVKELPRFSCEKCDASPLLLPQRIDGQTFPYIVLGRVPVLLAPRDFIYVVLEKEGHLLFRTGVAGLVTYPDGVAREITHADLAEGQAVLAAGRIQVSETRGLPRYRFDNVAPQYKPEGPQLRKVIQEALHQTLPTESFQVEFTRFPGGVESVPQKPTDLPERKEEEVGCEP